MFRLLLALLLLALVVAAQEGFWCETAADCDPLFVCVESECTCRFGRSPCMPPLFGFAPLNVMPRFNRRST